MDWHLKFILKFPFFVFPTNDINCIISEYVLLNMWLKLILHTQQMPHGRNIKEFLKFTLLKETK